MPFAASAAQRATPAPRPALWSAGITSVLCRLDRLDLDRELSRMLDEGEIDAADHDAIAEHIAECEGEARGLS